MLDSVTYMRDSVTDIVTRSRRWESKCAHSRIHPTGRPRAGRGVVHHLVAAAVAGVVGLMAWGVLATIERFSQRPARAWLAVSIGLLVLSLGGPLSGDGIATGNRLALVFMHLAAGAVLISLFFRSARPTSRSDR
jgi:hypothetical protein